MNWLVLIPILISAGAVSFSIYSYTLTRRRELAWKRTEFLFAQAQYLDNDSDLIEAVNILEGRHAEITISEILKDENLEKAIKNKHLKQIDKLLNFLWRLGYAYLETKTISEREVEAFGWYFRRISEIPSLTKYCDENGYVEINIVIAKLEYIKVLKE
jgi:hypothetical protein